MLRKAARSRKAYMKLQRYDQNVKYLGLFNWRSVQNADG